MANGFQGPPAFDFYSQLSGLGDVIAKNRADSAKKEAYAAALAPGADGKVDFGKAMTTIAPYDPHAAAVLGQVQAHKDSQENLAYTRDHTLKREKVEDDWSDTTRADSLRQHAESMAIQRQTADRLANPIPPGYQKTPDGNLAFRPGGPEDPATVQAQAVAKAKAAGGGLSLNPVYAKDKDGNTVLVQTGHDDNAVMSKLPDGVTLNGMDNETISADAARLNAGDDTILKKYDKKGQGRVDLLRLNNEANRQRVEKGLDPVDLTQAGITLQGDKARERSAGTMEGRMAPASIEAQGAFKIAQNAMDNLGRTNSVPLNKLLQMGQAAWSNPELKAAAVATNTAVMTYSRAIAPTGVGTVDSQQHAREILSTADGPKATAAAFAQLAREVDMAHASPGIAREYFAASRKARSEGKAAPAMPEYQPAQPARTAPPPEAISALKMDPRRSADFDAYYGSGASDAALGVRR